MIPGKTANTKCLLYSLVKILVGIWLTKSVCLNNFLITDYAQTLFCKIAMQYTR